MPRPPSLAFAVLILAAAFLAPVAAPLAEDVPAEANGVPTDIPKAQEPAVGWSLQNLEPEQQQRVLRFSTFVNHGIPDYYLKAENGVAYALTPSPTLLAYMVQQPIAVDQYLLWSIAEGGKQFGTAMPAFKNDLSEDQIWRIVAYLRAGFPAVDDGTATAKSDGAAKTDIPDFKKHMID